MSNKNSTQLRSSIFLSNLTVVDHAYINELGQVIGGSYNPGFIVTGEVDDVEKVVVDFSTIKKDLKSLIDRHIDDIDDNGFDHKLWWIEGVSVGTIEKHDHAERVVITTPAVKLELPVDAIRYIPFSDVTASYTMDYIGTAFEDYVTFHLSQKYPDINISVKCFNNIHTHRIDHWNPYRFFTYSHGLKDSTSYGCQNIAHGHLSFIQHESQEVLEKVTDLLDGAVFINRENVVNETDDFLAISYTTGRGYFYAEYKKANNSLIVLPTETTIEYIAEFVQHAFGISDFYISEGLSKGTYVS